jgi:small ubiquitin-related modifier
MLTRSATKRTRFSRPPPSKKPSKKKKQPPKKPRTKPRTRPVVSDDETQVSSSLRGSIRVLVPVRENEFNARSWWMVDLTCQTRQGATPLVARCMRTYGWKEVYARRVLKAYKQFLELKTLKKDWTASILSPCQDVDQMWHEHILDVVNYCHDTMILCGQVVGHDPDGMLDIQAKEERTKTTKEALKLSFGDDYDTEMWLSPQEQLQHLRATQPLHIIPSLKKSSREQRITLHVRYQTGELDFFEIGIDQKLLPLYYENVYSGGASITSLRFLLDGDRIDPEHTARILDLEDGDEILMMLEQGGC